MRKQLVTFLTGFLFGAGILWLLFSLIGDLGPGDSSEDLGGAAVASATDDQQPGPPVRFPYTIRGIVQDEQSRLISGADVTVTSEDGSVTRSAGTDDSGVFVVEDVPLDLYTVDVRAVGYEGASRLGVAPDGPVITVTLGMSGELIGRALHEGQPVADAVVHYGAPGVYPPGRARTNQQGAFVASEISDWAGVDVIAFGADSGTGFVRSTAGPGVLELTMRDAPLLQVEVTDGRTGQAVSEGLLVLSVGSLHTLSVAAPIHEGRAEVAGIPPGSIHARVLAPGCLEWGGSVTHTGEPILLTLESGTLITGSVVDELQQPLAGVRLRAEVIDSRRRRWSRGRDIDPVLDRLVRADGSHIFPAAEELRTNEDGTFSVSGIPAGRGRIYATHEGYRTGTSEYIDADGATDLVGVQISLERDGN